MKLERRRMLEKLHKWSPLLRFMPLIIWTLLKGTPYLINIKKPPKWTPR